MRRKSRRYQRKNTYYRRRKKNWLPFIIFVVVVGFFFWAIFQFFSVLLSNVRTETTAAELNIKKGRAEFQLSNEGSQWTPAFASQTFVEGDQLKTAKNSIIQLDFLDTSSLFLNQNTEIKIEKLEKTNSGKKSTTIKLKTGEVWGNTEKNKNDEQVLQYALYTDRLRLNIKGTIFNLESSATQDVVRLTKGHITVDILESDKTILDTIQMGVGQQLILNDETKARIQKKEEVLTLIDPEFIKSNWHVDNLENFDKSAAQGIREQLKQEENSNTTATEASDSISTETDLNALDEIVILSPKNDAIIPAEVDLIKIEGTAPSEAFQIQVNGYALSKFQPGDRKWSYFAATKFRTLKSGLNKYEVVAFSRDGRQSPIARVNVTFEGKTPIQPIPATQSTTSGRDQAVQTSDQSDNTPLAKPRIVSPAIFSQDTTAIYETSAAVVTIAGTVEPGTKEVRVNNFTLRKFETGNTTFSYIANANYGNMKKGENIFRIIAIGQNGEQSEQSIKIFYSPIEIQ